MKKLLLTLLLAAIGQYNHAQETSIRSFIFGHSLINHAFNVVPVPSNETAVPHWVFLLAEEAGRSYAAGGQYGFLPQHDDLPPTSQWGFDIVPGVWDEDIETFSEANIDNILITAGNFMQWQGPDEFYPGTSDTPISATSTIVDWVNASADNPRIYIYENWPDMAPYLSSGFPPTEADFTNYNAYLNGDFHDWWIDYHDALLAAHPGEELKMIPVGPILAGLLTDTPLSTIPLTELYEDDAPHGRASLYFLAGLVTYMATFQDKAPATFVVPSIVHHTIADHYWPTVNYIWDELNAFDFADGSSRVFFSAPLPVAFGGIYAVRDGANVNLRWSTSQEVNNEKFTVEHSTDGLLFESTGEVSGQGNSNGPESYSFVHHQAGAGPHYYRLQQRDFDGLATSSQVVYVEPEAESGWVSVAIAPNPSLDGRARLSVAVAEATEVQVRVYSALGRELQGAVRQLEAGRNEVELDYSLLGKGLFFVEVSSQKRRIFKKLLIE